MIKYPDNTFEAHLKQSSSPIYLLTGQEDFLLNEAACTLKKNWRATHQAETDEKRFSLEHANDWQALTEEARAYSLFHDKSILDATHAKKTIDAKTKQYLLQYAENPNTDCLLILRAPALTAKQYAPFQKHKSITCISIQALNVGAQVNWIKQQLKRRKFTYSDAIPKHIQTYTHGNLHAANQTLERLALMYEPGTEITIDALEAQLLDERQYKLYEISSACLEGNAQKALALTERAQRDHVEPILILWFITQELRILEQLAIGISYQALNIYSFRMQQYQRAQKRLSLERIHTLMQQSQALDTHIKSRSSEQTWLMTGQLVLAFAQ